MTDSSHENHFQLKSWMELVGTLTSFSKNAEYMQLNIDDKNLLFIEGSEEAKYLQTQPIEEFVGEAVGIIRTDLPSIPILIRLVAKGINNEESNF